MARRLPLALLSSLIVIATLVLVGATPAGAVTSGVNGRIVYASDQSGSLQIYAMRPNGTAPVQLTNSTGANYDPAYNGDGSRIAFISTRSGSPQLFQMLANGGRATLVSTPGVIPSHPTWAPNNSLIAFAGSNGTDSDIYTVKPNGTGMVDLTPDSTYADANPQWSPGGILIAFDRTNAAGTNIWTIQQQGTDLKQITTSNYDSNPSWSPDNQTLAFQSSRDNVTGLQTFAAVNQPVGMAFRPGGLLVTQQKKDRVSVLDTQGNLTTWVNLPSTGSADIERYIADSPGLGCFPVDEVYVSVKQTIYAIDPVTKIVTTFATIPSLPNSNNFLTFDDVGTFDYNLIVVGGQDSTVYKVDCTGNATLVKDLSGVTGELEGAQVAPLNFIPYGGDLIVTAKFKNAVYAIAPDGTYSLVGNWPSPEQVIFVPSSICNWSNSGGAFFLNAKGQNETFKFSADSFPGLAGTPTALITSEDASGIGQFTSNGTSIDISQFYGPIGDGTGDIEEGGFATGCPSAAPRASAQATPTNEIYTMTSSGSNQVRLTNNTTNDVRPAWSPDGTSIVFASDRDDPNQPGCEAAGTCLYDVYAMTPAGANQINLTNDLAFNDTSPDWESVAYSAITVDDFAYTPSTAKPKLGGTVLWEFSSEHTVTDNSSPNMGLFDSRIKEAGQFFVFNFVGAGQYPIICKIHSTMTMTVKVPMKAVPSFGSLSTVFTITWASAAPPRGYGFDVQIMRPGSTLWENWQTLTPLAFTTFTADAGTGTYIFQARLHNSRNDGTSNYSAPVSITVNP